MSECLVDIFILRSSTFLPVKKKFLKTVILRQENRIKSGNWRINLTNYLFIKGIFAFYGSFTKF